MASNPPEQLEGRVLVVDDDRSFQLMVVAALAQIGMEAVCVRTGEEALRMCEATSPRAVVLDGLLPGIRGDEVARRMRKLPGVAQTPILFISAFFRDMKSYEQLSNAGVSAILHKPVEQEQVKRALQALLGGTDEGEDVEVEESGVPAPEMAQLLADYLADARTRAKAMTDAVATLSERGSDEVRRMLRTEAHRLRGSGASFGIPEISRLAGELEDLITAHSRDDVLGSDVRAKLAGLAEALLQKVNAAAGTAPIATRRAPDLPPRVYLLDAAESELSSSFAVVGGATKEVRAFGSLEELLDVASGTRPDAVLVSGDEPFGLPAVERLRAAGQSPILLIGTSSALEDRLAAVRAGAVAYVPRPADAEAAFALAAAYVGPPPGSRVLAVDDDRLLLTLMAEALAPHGIALEPCNDPAQMMESLGRALPELILMDMELPGAGGLDLTRVLRADPGLRRLPVIVVSGHSRPEDRSAAFEAGADDFLAKPFEPEELAARVRAHLHRQRVLDRDPGRDPHTGVAGRAYLVEVCERALALASRSGRSLALIAVDVNLPELTAAHGPIAAQSVVDGLSAHLRSSFRASDMVARIGPGRVAVLLHDVSAHDAERLLVVELSAFATRSFAGPAGTFRPVLRGDLVCFPETTGGARELLAELERRVEKRLAAAPAA